MSDTAAIGERDEAVAEAITSGRSLRLVRKEFSLTEAELDAVLERLWPVSTEARIRMIKHDVGCLQRLIEKFYEKALGGDVNSATLVVKAWERKAALLGLDAVQRIDLQIIRPPDAPSQYDRITAALMSLKYGPNGRDGAAPSDAAPPADDAESRSTDG
jgi:hypothetical protein